MPWFSLLGLAVVFAITRIVAYFWPAQSSPKKGSDQSDSVGQVGERSPYESLQDYCKHISTLCTGSILVAVTFLATFEDIPLAQQDGSYAIFLVAWAAVSALVAQGLALFRPEGEKASFYYFKFVTVIITFAVLLFVTGFYHLAEFTSENIGRQLEQAQEK